MASAQEKMWLARYLTHFNAKRAAEEAGYKWPRRMGYKKKQKFAAEISQALEEKAMDSAENLAHLAEIARREYAKYINANGKVDLARMKADEKMHLVKGTKWDRDGRLVVTFYDGQTALNTIRSHHDKAASGHEDDPIHVKGDVLRIVEHVDE